MPTITFSEQALNTVNPTYKYTNNFAAFEGEIVSDSSQPTSPVIAANTSYNGPVNFDFQVAVSTVSFEVGYFDAVGSTTVNYYNSAGKLLFTQNNSQLGLQQFSYTNNKGIARIEVVKAGPDASGFGVDTVSFTTLKPVAVTAPADTDIKALLWGSKWGYTNLSWSAPTAASAYTDNGYAAVNGFAKMNAEQVSAIQSILDSVQAFSGLKFTKTNNQDYADLRFAEATSVNDGDGLDTISTAMGGPPQTGRAAAGWGDNWFNSSNYNEPSVGSFAYSAGFMHEIGHSLGLKHGHSAPALDANRNSYEFSVMTYSQYVGDTNAGDSAPEHPTTFMMADLKALQFMYGANYKTNKGNSTYSWDPATGEMSIDGTGQGAPGSNYILMTIWDGGGTDTYDFSNYANGVKVDLRPGNWSTTAANQLADLGDGNSARWNIANAELYKNNKASLIENATGGAGNDLIVGNEVKNLLKGKGGNDKLLGLRGNDTLYGGGGDDKLYGGTSKDTLYGDEGKDRLYGNKGGDTLFGDAGSDTLFAGADSDWLFGGSGLDKLYGGDGDDFFYGGGGNDRVYGGNGNDRLIGNAGGDKLYGGKGNDILRGNSGNDRFYFRNDYDKDKIVDFEDNADTIELYSNLWTGTKTVFKVLKQFGTQVGADFVFDFGGGDILTVQNATRVELRNDIDII